MPIIGLTHLDMQLGIAGRAYPQNNNRVMGEDDVAEDCYLTTQHALELVNANEQLIEIYVSMIKYHGLTAIRRVSYEAIENMTGINLWDCDFATLENDFRDRHPTLCPIIMEVNEYLLENYNLTRPENDEYCFSQIIPYVTTEGYAILPPPTNSHPTSPVSTNDNIGQTLTPSPEPIPVPENQMFAPDAPLRLIRMDLPNRPVNAIVTWRESEIGIIEVDMRELRLMPGGVEPVAELNHETVQVLTNVVEIPQYSTVEDKDLVVENQIIESTPYQVFTHYLSDPENSGIIPDFFADTPRENIENEQSVIPLNIRIDLIGPAVPPPLEDTPPSPASGIDLPAWSELMISDQGRDVHQHLRDLAERFSNRISIECLTEASTQIPMVPLVLGTLALVDALFPRLRSPWSRNFGRRRTARNTTYPMSRHDVQIFDKCVRLYRRARTSVQHLHVQIEYLKITGREWTKTVDYINNLYEEAAGIHLDGNLPRLRGRPIGQLITERRNIPEDVYNCLTGNFHLISDALSEILISMATEVMNLHLDVWRNVWEDATGIEFMLSILLFRQHDNSYNVEEVRAIRSAHTKLENLEHARRIRCQEESNSTRNSTPDIDYRELARYKREILREVAHGRGSTPPSPEENNWQPF